MTWRKEDERIRSDQTLKESSSSLIKTWYSDKGILQGSRYLQKPNKEKLE